MRSEKNAGVGAAGEWVQQQLVSRCALRKSGHHPAGPHGSVRGAFLVAGLLPREKKHARQTTRSRTRAESVEECGLRQCEKTVCSVFLCILS